MLGHIDVHDAESHLVCGADVALDRIHLTHSAGMQQERMSILTIQDSFGSSTLFAGSGDPRSSGLPYSLILAWIEKTLSLLEVLTDREG